MRELVTDDEARSWITEWRERWNAETDGSWAITAATGQVLGQTALRGVSLEFGRGQMLSELLHTDGWHDLHVHAFLAG